MIAPVVFHLFSTLVLPFSPSIGAMFTYLFPLVLVLSLGEMNRIQSCKQRGPERTPDWDHFILQG